MIGTPMTSPLRGRIAIPAAILAALLCGCDSKPAENTKAPAAAATPIPTEFAAVEVDLSNVKWETNLDDPPVGSEKAIRGGTFTVATSAYPLTFRLHGPDSNDLFANFNRPYATDFTLTMLHPTTDRFIPCLATHWSVSADGKTLLFKLDPDVRWSDGKPVTADDYLFAYEFLKNPLNLDPFSNQRMEDYFEGVDKIDDHTIRIRGKVESWRPLYDYSGFSPLPRHAIVLDAEWSKRDNYKPPVVVGPYTITDAVQGERVEFTRIAKWWGDGKHYFRGMYNPDKIVVRVIVEDDREFDFMKKGQLSFYNVSSARQWATEMNFDAMEKGWVKRKRVFLESPEGVSGFALNLKTPLFQSKDFRKGLQHLFNFEELNKNVMYSAYYRKASVFYGTEFQNPDQQPYAYDPRMAREFLAKAGFDKRGSDGVLVNTKGERASFTLLYATKSFEPHLSLIQNAYKAAGVEVKLQFLDGGALFNRALEKGFDALMISMTGGYYPEPHQYFSTEFKDKPQNNNFWGFGTAETDKLIDVYRFGKVAEERVKAMHELDRIIHDEAFIILFWTSSYMRFLYRYDVDFPESYQPKRAQTALEYQTFWIDPAKTKELEDAMKAGASLPLDPKVDEDPYGVKAALEKAGAGT